MFVPPKKSQEQIQAERQILSAGFNTPFWHVLKASIESEMNARYRLLPTIESKAELRKIQGQIAAFEQILGFEVPYKPQRT